MAQFTFGDHAFPTKTAARDFIRLVISNYKTGQRMGDSDVEFFLALVREHHRHADQKLHKPVVGIEVRSDPTFPRTRQLWLIYDDGTENDVSWTVCLNPKDHVADVKAAARQAIKKQITEQRDFLLMLYDRCELTGAELSYKNCHVDHYPISFADLLDSWMRENGLRFEDVKVNPPTPGDVITCMIDPEQLQSWQDYHGRHARFRLLSPEGHLRQKKVACG